MRSGDFFGMPSDPQNASITSALTGPANGGSMSMGAAPADPAASIASSSVQAQQAGKLASPGITPAPDMKPPAIAPQGGPTAAPGVMAPPGGQPAPMKLPPLVTPAGGGPNGQPVSAPPLTTPVVPPSIGGRPNGQPVGMDPRKVLWALHAAQNGQQFSPADPMYPYVARGFRAPGQPFDLNHAIRQNGLWDHYVGGPGRGPGPHGGALQPGAVTAYV